jgi:hypothetical protein
MALDITTLGAALAVGSTKCTVAAATGIVAGDIVKIDDEMATVTAAYVVGSLQVPLNRGQLGTIAAAHVSGANFISGAASDSAWGNVGASVVVPQPLAGRTRRLTSYSADGAITLPDPGSDAVAILNGTAQLDMTVAAPSKDQDGSFLYVTANGDAAHTVTFAGGFGGAGSSYDVLTLAASPVLMIVMAVNGKWVFPVGAAITGTVTNITAGVA